MTGPGVIFKKTVPLAGAVGALALAFVLLGTPEGRAQVDPQRAIYDNDAEFQQLSGAAQALLELKFGKKPSTSAPRLAIPFSSLTITSPIAGPLAPPANILVNNPGADLTAQDTQSETSLVVAPGQVVVVGFNDSGSFVAPPPLNHFTGWARSNNGGTSFTDMGRLPASANGDAGDPVLARSASGTIYFATLRFSGSGLQVFPSVDNGLTFGAPVNGAPGTTGFDDKEWITTDNFAGPGQNNVYLAWRNFGGSNGIRFTRSTDGGVTFGPAGGIAIAPGGQGAFVAVGPDHSVYVFYWSGSIFVRRSTDQGVTFGPAVLVTTLNSTGINGDLALNGGFRSSSFPHAAVNPVNGHVYVVYNNCSSSPCTTAADHGNIFFRRSSDNGATWSAPVQVNDDATTNDQYMPTVAVTPNGASVGVSWYDRRLSANNTLIDRFAAVGAVNLATGAVSFQPNQRISTVSFPVARAQDPVVNTTYMGDYDQIVASGNTDFCLTWGDNRNPHAPFHANQPDVFFAKIAAACPPPVISNASATPSILWPPNHKMQNVKIAYTVTSACPANCTLSVASNQPVNGTGDGDTAPDWVVLGPNLVQLRAERSGDLGTRVYTITITCTNDGGPTTRQVQVVVPHDQ